MASVGDDAAGCEGRRLAVVEVVLRVKYLLCELLLLEVKDDEEMVVVGLVPLKLTLRDADEEEDSQETDCVMRETKLEDVRGEAGGYGKAVAVAVAVLVLFPAGNVLLLLCWWFSPVVVLLLLENVGRALRKGTLADRNAAAAAADLSTAGVLL
jgi:hypothetical protein